ncbi:hypothetical protein FRC09_007144 [Ceratobasidium sp. 395]|nr:hypothetical protein FRC09_007144 [Ceratobasidium sp. 395]
MPPVTRQMQLGCDAQQREAFRRDSALQRLVNPDYNLAPRRPRERRKYHRRDPPPGPPPVRQPSPSHSASQQPNPPPAPPEQRQQVDANMLPGDPVQAEYDALLRELPRHPDFRFDTPGAGPSCFRNPLDRPPTFPSTLFGAPELAPDLADPRRVQDEAQPWLAGLSTEERMQMGMDEHIAQHGGRKLTPLEMLAVRGFNYKIDTGITSRAFGKLPQAFPELDHLPTEARIKTRIEALSGIEGTPIEMCEDSCVAFTGAYEPLKQCPRCGKDRYEPDPGNPDALRPK